MQGSKSMPYLSIVVASRNDNHGGDMHKRMRIFMRALIYQCNKFKLPCELIIVEWNPPPDRPSLKEILPGLAAGDYLEVRFIQVPNHLHTGLAFSQQIPLFQMIAKNVGIRRAKAGFVLCTNVDLIFSDGIFKRLALQNLQRGCFYRANRCDVPNTIDENVSVEDQIAFCKRNIKKRLGKNHLYPEITDTTSWVFRYQRLVPLLKFYSKLRTKNISPEEERLIELDFDACGDFTLMSKQDWENIQGYPELEMYSIHIDSMGIMAAAAQNMEQVIFTGDECTYHMEHSAGWDFADPIEKLFFYTKKPMLDWWTARGAGLHIMKARSKFNLNKENWGLADVTLEES